ncbi:MAG: GspH/FimT family pseudopilin [Burkholderiaceae bacterium]|nr:GspH/FimT family pseudopilin [Burkholderiaceae bacterium]
MLITIVIVGIVAMIAMPSFTETAARQRVRSVASDLHTTLLRARSEAIKRNADVRVEPLAGGWTNGWRVIDVSTADPETIEVRQDVPKALSISGAASLTYRSSGRLSAAATMEIASSVVSSVSRCLRTDLSGRPAITAGAC